MWVVPELRTRSREGDGKGDIVGPHDFRRDRWRTCFESTLHLLGVNFKEVRVDSYVSKTTGRMEWFSPECTAWQVCSLIYSDIGVCCVPFAPADSRSTDRQCLATGG